MIDLLYDAKLDKKKPRDYRRKARQAYLNNRNGCTTTIRIASPTGLLFVEQIKRGGAISWIINMNPEGSNVCRINLRVKIRPHRGRTYLPNILAINISILRIEDVSEVYGF